MEEYAKGIGARTREFDSHADKSVVTNLDFKFNSKFCTLSITIENKPPQLFKFKYLEENFQVIYGPKIIDLGVGILDLTAINNIYQIKLVDQLLVKTLKKGMQLINRFKARYIFDESKDKRIQTLVKSANDTASKIAKEFDDKFSKILSIVEDAQLEIYDRSPLITKTRDELMDNLNRKYVLVINQLIELQRGALIQESDLSKQVEELINSL